MANIKNPKQIIKDRFVNVKFKKIILFKNPNECCNLQLERVNPTHKGIVWGRRKKRLHKGNNYIRIAYVYFYSFFMFSCLGMLTYIDKFFNFAFMLIIKVGLISMLMSFLLVILFCLSMNNTKEVVKKCLSLTQYYRH